MSKILIVDNQKAIAALLKIQLKDCDVIEANNGGEALKKVHEEKPDLILLDSIMPGIDGYSVLSIIKNAEETKSTPVIIVTDRVGDEDRIKFLEKGADDYIVKPYNTPVLVTRIRNLLRSRSVMQNQLNSVQDMVISLTTALEAKDQYSVRHSNRTAFYAEKLAQRFYLVKTLRNHIRMAGLLHDIGKIGIKDSILLKPGKLDEGEFEIVKSHPEAGEKICSFITSLKPILPFIRHHHERFDGTGYPDGLKGADIPLGARILAIADSFDALTSDRPYRKSFNQDQAIDILREGTGTQWDDQLVSRFCEMLLTDPSVATQESMWYFEEHNMLNPSFKV